MIKKFLIAIVGFILLVAALGAVKVAQVKEVMSVNHTPPPSAVTTADARTEQWVPQLKAIGSIAPVQGVTISAELEGTVVKIAVENGATVNEGDLLIELDTAVEEAQVAAAKARTTLAKLQRDRSVGLLEKNTISQAELDSASAQYDQTVAELAGLQATIEKKKIKAPFSGRVGIRQINLGQFVTRGQPLLPIQKLDPVYVNFNVPQQQLPSLRIGAEVKVSLDGAAVVVPGKITAINSEVDASTRNVAVQATLSNPEEILRTGMFVQVEVMLPGSDSVVVIPSTAVAFASYGNSVYIVEKMKGPNGGEEYLGVRQQPVKLGRSRGDQIAVVEGLKAGDTVVSSGVFKLRNGIAVQINNAVQPSNSSTPKPANT